jgi:hypothetical protein
MVHQIQQVRPHSAIGDRTPLSLFHRLQHDAEAGNPTEILIGSNFWNAPRKEAPPANAGPKKGRSGAPKRVIRTEPR